jgi:hypothetical protein
MTAVKTVEEKSLAVNVDDFGTAPISSSDIIIPKIELMQKMSKKLDSNSDLREGDLIDTLTNEAIGGMKQPIQFIPFYMEKVWFRSVKNGKDFELISIEDVTPENEALRYSDVVGGKEYKNEMHMRFYGLLPTDTSLPYIITFKGMSLKKGKALATQMYIKNRAANLTPAAKVMDISVSKETNDKGSYCTMSASINRNTTAEELQTALLWYKTISTSRDSLKQTELKQAKRGDASPTADSHDASVDDSDF